MLPGLNDYMFSPAFILCNDAKASIYYLANIMFSLSLILFLPTASLSNRLKDTKFIKSRRIAAIKSAAAILPCYPCRQRETIVT